MNVYKIGQVIDDFKYHQEGLQFDESNCKIEQGLLQKFLN